MNNKKLFILFFVTLFLVGVSYATEATNDTNTKDISKSEITTEKIVKNNNMNIKKENNILTDNKTKKEITKQYNTTVKSAMKYNVNDFDTLHKALTNDKYDTLSLNFKSDIKLTNNTLINPAIKTLKINGNGKTINADYKYQFFNTRLNKNINIVLTNIHLIHYYYFGYGMNDYTIEYSKGIIYNGGNLTIDNCTFNNKGGKGIANSGNLTVKNCIFNGFTEQEAIYNIGSLTVNNSFFTESIENEGTLIINNSIFKGSSSENSGSIFNYGSIITKNCTFYGSNREIGSEIYNRGKINIDNCTFNNIHISDIGAILNIKTMTITNSIFTNNTSYTAIIENVGTLTIKNTRFEENKYSDSGTIFNSGTLTIHKSIFKNNTATSGGAIYTYGNVTIIKNSTFNNNTALKNGGAIYNYGSKKIDITGNIFSENNANEGSAIYSGLELKYNYTTQTISKIKNTGSNLIINNNTFIENKANSTNKVMAVNGPSISYNNTFYPHSRFNSTIFSEANNSKIINNIFTIIPDTKITINNVPNTQYKDKVTIKGTLKTIHDYKLENQNISIKVNSVNIGTAITNVNGTFTYNYETTTLGQNIVTASYKGNNSYNPSSNNTTFKVTVKPTKITINKIATTEYKNNAIIKGTFKTTNGKPIQSAKLNIKINGKTVGITKTNKNGIFTYKYKTKKIGKNNITISFTENNGYKKNTAKTTFKVTLKRTKITINNIPKTTPSNYKNYITKT